MIMHFTVYSHLRRSEKIELKYLFFFSAKVAQNLKPPRVHESLPLCIICVHSGKSRDKCFLSSLGLADACSGSHFIASSKPMRWQLQKDLAWGKSLQGASCRIHMLGSCCVFGPLNKGRSVIFGWESMDSQKGDERRFTLKDLAGLAAVCLSLRPSASKPPPAVCGGDMPDTWKPIGRDFKRCGRPGLALGGDRMASSNSTLQKDGGLEDIGRRAG